MTAGRCWRLRLSFTWSREIFTVWSSCTVFVSERETRQTDRRIERQVIIVWLCPYVLYVFKCSEGAQQPSWEGFKAGPGSSWHGNAPLATTSRLPGDMHHSSETLHTYTNPHTHINILWQSPHVHMQSACISKRNSRKNKIGHGGAIFHLHRVCVYVCVCLHLLGLNLLALQHVCSLSNELTDKEARQDVIKHNQVKRRGEG